MCFKIKEDLAALDDGFLIDNIYSAFPEELGAMISTLHLGMGDPNKVYTACVYPELREVTVEEVIAVFTKLGLHVTLINEDE